ncbi:conserved hypothetical protein [Ricinus communis]|uniref:Uncharacterized protein n=1 Tax=Ricinus communis TaxID=3988 RepID=B9TAU3_RICCO|nr:conserved hypothetical protein [Ricinus communis]
MGMGIDEAGRHYLAAGVYPLRRLAMRQVADLGNAAMANTDVGAESWRLAAIDDRAAGDQQIECWTVLHLHVSYELVERNQEVWEDDVSGRVAAGAAGGANRQVMAMRKDIMAEPTRNQKAARPVALPIRCEGKCFSGTEKTVA